MQRFGIDVSHWQGDFNFANAKKNEGVEFAILKAGGGDDGLYKDRQFDNNYIRCEAIDLPKGAYFFGNAKTEDAAKKEAEYFLTLLKGKRFEYPVYYDVEGSMLNVNRRTLTNIVKTFCSIVESAGYWVGIYSSESAFNNNMFDSQLARYSHWIARWSNNKPNLNSNAEAQMWQFGGETNLIRSNKVNGQVVDQNYCYVDYPSVIKECKLNGFGTVIKKSDYEIADEVIAGVWGNGEDRKNRLTQAGYDYDVVQSIVNSKFNKKSVDELAREVIAGKWGNGAERKNRLESEGYDYVSIQDKVNELLR